MCICQILKFLVFQKNKHSLQFVYNKLANESWQIKAGKLTIKCMRALWIWQLSRPRSYYSNRTPILHMFQMNKQIKTHHRFELFQHYNKHSAPIKYINFDINLSTLKSVISV